MMPLCERIRIDAGRPFIKTLTARIYVALFLVSLTLVNINKNSETANTYQTEFGKQEINQKIILNTSNNDLVIAKNDKYGR